MPKLRHHPADLSSLLAVIRHRDYRGGITTAHAYLKDLEGCLVGEACPTRFLGGTSESHWRRALKESRARLVYSHKDMAVVNSSRVAGAFESAIDQSMFEGVPANACAVFDCVVTSKRKDRDGDVLETVGAKLDPAAPLLWQHLPFEPIGKVIRELSRSGNLMQARLAIIDNALGRDANELLEFGALRVSHGFIPELFEPLDPQDPWGGFRIKKFEIMEVSLVSVPSNTDSVVTAFSRRKLHHPLVKQWAGNLFAARPAQGKGRPAARGNSVDLLESTAVIAIDKLEAICPECAARAKKLGLTGLKVSALAKQIPAHLLEGLCDRLSGEEHPWEACMDMDFGEFQPEDQEAFCAFLKRECGLDEDEEKEKAGPRRTRAGQPITRTIGHIDIASAVFEPQQRIHEIAASFIGCRLRDLRLSGTFAPTYRMGGFLSAAKEVLSEHALVDMRRLSDGGYEGPPKYETIQLNSKKRAEFLVEGIEFRSSERAGPFLVCYDRNYGGISLTTYCHQDKSEVLQAAVDRAWELTKTTYCFLRGEAFSLTGDFLERTDETWSDVFLEPVNEKALRVVAKQFNEKGRRFVNRGMLMMGAPGTGKTLSVRILRNECHGTFIWCSAKDFWHTGGMGGVASAFETAKELAPSIVCFEDIDNWISGNVIDLLKSEMDGVGRFSGVLTVMTTNYPELLPEALIDRPGRFHDVLKFGLPDQAVRLDMLRKWLPDLNEEALASAVIGTDGMSGAHLYELAQFARTIQEQEDGPPSQLGVAVNEALRKVSEQRELIDEVQRGGGYSRLNRGFELNAKGIEMAKKIAKNIAKAKKPAPGKDDEEAVAACDECGGEMVDGECQDCGIKLKPDGEKEPVGAGDHGVPDTCPACGTPMAGAAKCPACGAARSEQPGMKAKGEEDGEKTKEDAPNYRDAGTESESCGACGNFELNSSTCRKFGFITEKTKLCDAFQPAEVTSDDRETAKAVSPRMVTAKSGRTLSTKNEQSIKDARDDVHEITRHEALPRTVVSLAKGAVAKLDSVLASVARPVPQQEATAEVVTAGIGGKSHEEALAEWLVYHLPGTDSKMLGTLGDAIVAELDRRGVEEIGLGLEELMLATV